MTDITRDSQGRILAPGQTEEDRDAIDAANLDVLRRAGRLWNRVGAPNPDDLNGGEDD